LAQSCGPFSLLSLVVCSEVKVDHVAARVIEYYDNPIGKGVEMFLPVMNQYVGGYWGGVVEMFLQVLSKQ
jgi:hypothetical protein